MLVQTVHFGFEIGDVPVPCRYMAGASSINLRRSTQYGPETLWVVARYWLHRLRLVRCDLFEPEDPSQGGGTRFRGHIARRSGGWHGHACVRLSDNSFAGLHLEDGCPTSMPPVPPGPAGALGGGG